MTESAVPERRHEHHHPRTLYGLSGQQGALLTIRKMAHRQHYRVDGSEKVRYDDLVAAEAAAVIAGAKAPASIVIDAYACPQCDGWHIGGRPKERRFGLGDRLFVDVLQDEIGDRAVGCLAAENAGRRNKRAKAVMGRVDAARRRRTANGSGI